MIRWFAAEQGRDGQPTRRLARALSVLALGFLAPGGFLSTAAHAAEPEAERVAIRAAPHDGYARLVFDWPGPITFERTEAEGSLTLRFARPFAADLGAVPERLSDYLLDIERLDDRRGVRLHLRVDVHARLSQFEPDLVVVDLERQGTAISGDDAGVVVRTGAHAGFVRIVFEWPGPVQFRQRRNGREMTLEFDRRAQIDAAALTRRLRPWLQELTGRSAAQGSRMRLRLAPGLDARAFAVEENRVVVDLLESTGGGPEATTSDRASAEAPSTRSAAEASDVAQVAERGRGATGSNGMPPEAGPAATTTGETDPVPLEIDTAPRDDGIVLTFNWARPVPAAVFIRGDHLWTVFGAPVPAEADFPPALGAGADAYLGPAAAVELEGGTALQFPLSRTVNAAVARDGPAWQVVLGDRATKARPVPVERFGEPSQLRVRAGAGGKLLHLVDPAVGDRLTIWPLLEAGRGQPGGRRLVDLELIETAQGVVWRPLSDRLEAELTERGVEFDAPGGLSLSSPASPSATGADTTAGEGQNDGSSVDDDAHAAAQPSEAPTEDLPAVDFDAGAAVDRTARATPTPPRESSPTEPSPAPVPGPPLGLAAAGVGPGVDVMTRRDQLIRALEVASPEGRGRARVNLARFYLAQALAPETLAVLRHRSGGDGTVPAALELARQSLVGAAELLMGHLQRAETALDTPALDHDREVALWRAVLAAARNDWPTAAHELGRSERTLATYPTALQVRLGVPAALIGVETGDTSGAFAILDRLADLELHEADRARVSFVRGLAHARAGALEQADRIWRRLEHSAHDETRIKAAYARATMRLDSGLIDAGTALAELEAARPLWRGHPWELAMLDGLAHVRAEGGDRAGAIRTWQEALRRFLEAARGQQTTEAMRAAFRDALIEGGEDSLDFLRAFALYRDFPELMPQGREGERLRRRLAQGLAALDLIKPAAELLGMLIHGHPGGVAKAEIGADLAALRLRAPDAKAAVDALEVSRAAVELPELLSDRRQLLRARALAQLGQHQAALELLVGRDDPPAERLRLGIYWRQETWSKVVPSIEALLRRRDDPDAPLSEDEQALVIRLAIAHHRLGDADALARLRTRFGPVMPGGPDRAAFLVATMTSRRGTPAAASVLAAAEDHIGDLEDYLAHATSIR